MNILVLVAGTNEPSNSNMLADAFIQGMKQHSNVTVDKRRLKDLQINHFSLEHYNPTFRHEEDFRNLQHLIEKADGLVIASPVWNFSVPAHLKNLIDRIARFALDGTKTKGTLRNTPLFCIYTGGTPYVVWKGMMRLTTSHVTEAMKYFGALPMGIHFEPRCTRGKGVFGLVVDGRPQSLSTVKQKGQDFIVRIRKYRESGTLPLGTRIAKLFFEWGRAFVTKITP